MLITMWYSLCVFSSCLFEKQKSLYMLSTMWYSPITVSFLFQKQNSLYLCSVVTSQYHVVFTPWYVRFLSVREAELSICFSPCGIPSMICPVPVCLRSRTPYMLSTMWYSLYDMSASRLLKKQNSLYAQHDVVFILWYVCFLSAEGSELLICSAPCGTHSMICLLRKQLWGKQWRVSPFLFLSLNI